MALSGCEKAGSCHPGGDRLGARADLNTESAEADAGNEALSVTSTPGTISSRGPF